jgi:sigma-54 dependent transcriptional regulator, acetoin dehydrogenase operon transcriptional activator AcoR
MLNLSHISQFIQQAIEATAAVIEIDITVIDHQLIRIAGTGIYAEQVGTQITPTAAFVQVLKTSEPVFIFNPQTDVECHDCEKHSSCDEVANIAFPILINGTAQGIFAMIAFNEQQRLKLIRQKLNFSQFIRKMTELIASKLIENRSEKQLLQASKRLESIICSFPDGVVFTDENGRIVSCNPSACRMTGLKPEELLDKNLDLLNLQKTIKFTKVENSQQYTELSLEIKGKVKRFLCSVHPITHDGGFMGAVAYLKDYEVVRDLLSEVGEYTNYFSFDNILGSDPEFVLTKNRAMKAALSDSTVLIHGESGTGKELFARGVHAYSRRKNKVFIALNCAAIPESLLESELFGYEGGAFTGARTKGKPGKFELASGGTIFLDEIGDLPLSIQAKLLRVLEEKNVTRLGGVKSTSVDVRVIAATNKNLEELVMKREFRDDLYYRLNVIPMRIPPLRNRTQDIPVLIQYYFNQFKDFNTMVRSLSPEAFELLNTYSWPGNVRELKNALEYAVNMADSPIIFPEHLPEKIRTSFSTDSDHQSVLIPLETLEINLLKQGLKTYGASEKGKIEIAKKLGISRASVYRKLKKYGLG